MLFPTTKPVRLAPLLALLVACSSSCGGEETSPANPDPSASAGEDQPARDLEGGTVAAPAQPEGRAVAIFAGGCFWCMEGPFEALGGVDSVLSGYAGGPEQHPSYRDVAHHRTGHAEAIRVVYDPAVVSYEQLLEVFFHNVDPTDEGGQFCDRGEQYRTAIFPVDDEQRTAARAAIERAGEQLDETIATRLESFDHFWVAEDYHQDFYRTNPEHYTRYRRGCGRDDRLRELWGDAAGH